MKSIAIVVVFICISCVRSYSSENNEITEIKKYTDEIISNLIKKEYLVVYNSRPQRVNDQESFELFEENVSKIKIDSIPELLYHEKTHKSSEITLYYKSNSDTEVIKIIVEQNKREYEFISVEIIKAEYKDYKSNVNVKRKLSIQEKVEIGILITIVTLTASLIIFSITFGGAIDLDPLM